MGFLLGLFDLWGFFDFVVLVFFFHLNDGNFWLGLVAGRKCKKKKKYWYCYFRFNIDFVLGKNLP